MSNQIKERYGQRIKIRLSETEVISGVLKRTTPTPIILDGKVVMVQKSENVLVLDHEYDIYGDRCKIIPLADSVIIED